ALAAAMPLRCEGPGDDPGPVRMLDGSASQCERSARSGARSSVRFVSDGGEQFEYRFLNSRVHLPPTSNAFHAARHEPELIDSDTEQQFADAARRRAQQRRIDAYSTMRSTVFQSLDEFVDVVGPGSGVGSTVRAARRSIERLRAKLVR